VADLMRRVGSWLTGTRMHAQALMFSAKTENAPIHALSAAALYGRLTPYGVVAGAISCFLFWTCSIDYQHPT